MPAGIKLDNVQIGDSWRLAIDLATGALMLKYSTNNFIDYTTVQTFSPPT